MIGVVALSTVLLPIQGSSTVCRMYLCCVGWFDNGVTLHIEEDCVPKLEEDNGSLWCLHPHGTSVGFGFSINGALRYKADLPARYLHPTVAAKIGAARLERVSGVMAPILFKLPFVRALLLLFGCSTPATKPASEPCTCPPFIFPPTPSQVLFAAVHDLMRRRSDFGILPGGMEEVSCRQG